MDVILATGNPSKALQIQELLSDSSVRVQPLTGIIIPDEVEDGETERDNALKKAWFVHERMPGSWVMADDTGLYITALGGLPGVHAKRWLGDIPTDEITRGTLERLAGVKDRSALFRTVAVVVSPESDCFSFTGEIRGELRETPACKPQPAMPYSPLFVPQGEILCWAQMTTDHENRISHRGKAFSQVREFFANLPQSK